MSNIINFKKTYGSLRLAMKVKNLPKVWLLIWGIRIATAIQTVVGYYNHLIHMVVKSERHLIKSAHIFI